LYNSSNSDTQLRTSLVGIRAFCQNINVSSSVTAHFHVNLTWLLKC
jgi:hypothetical protein